MLFTALFALAALAEASPEATIYKRQGSTTMLRFGCPQIVIDRVDPLVNPNVIPSPHVHQIVGGNAFNATIPSTDVSALASCTSCQFSEDLSNYWTYVDVLSPIFLSLETELLRAFWRNLVQNDETEQEIVSTSTRKKVSYIIILLSYR